MFLAGSRVGLIDCDDTVGWQVLEDLSLAARPEYFESRRPGFTAEAEVETRVGTREITSGRADLPELGPAAGADSETSAHAESIALTAPRPHGQPPIPIAPLIAHQDRRTAAVGHDDVEVPVVVIVSCRGAATDMADTKR